MPQQIRDTACRRGRLRERHSVGAGRRMSCWRMLSVSIAAVVALSTAGVAGANPEAAGDPNDFHILSAQDLCNLAWPTSQAMPNPQKFGLICVRYGGVLQRMSKMMPTFFTDTFVLDPGSTLALPIGSTRINSEDPLSAWVIPNCHVPNRIDCS